MEPAGSLRCFVAVGVSDDVRTRLETVTERLRSAVSNVKWVEPHNYHLTVKFLGQIPRGLIPSVSQGLKAASERSFSFSIELQGIGAFPDIRRPRVIWAGIASGTGEFRKLWEAVEEELSHRGFEREPKGFSPHLTLGRIRHPGASAPQFAELARSSQDSLGKIEVNELLLMESHLSPKGPEYRVLERHGLRKRLA